MDEQVEIVNGGETRGEGALEGGLRGGERRELLRCERITERWRREGAEPIGVL